MFYFSFPVRCFVVFKNKRMFVDSFFKWYGYSNKVISFSGCGNVITTLIKEKRSLVVKVMMAE